MLTADCKNVNSHLYKLLDSNQKLIKEKIVEERKNIYFNGYIIGLILSFIVIFINKSVLKRKFNIWKIVCFVGCITFTTNYFYYILSPKTTYMIQHLNSQDQINEWLNVYRIMQIKYHVGLVFGIIAIMLFAYANRC
tara:strand:- start:48 stop:458 length:411 start_codon:yes stop_codon:yes gene_type:complete